MSTPTATLKWVNDSKLTIVGLSEPDDSYCTGFNSCPPCPLSPVKCGHLSRCPDADGDIASRRSENSSQRPKRSLTGGYMHSYA